MRVLVTGASGFVGGHVAARLAAAGHDVSALTRHPPHYEGAGRPVRGDVLDRAGLAVALAGQEAAYYLVHSLDHPDFVERDRTAAANFAAAAVEAGVEQVVYLGGLGDEHQHLSAHLRSRREVERILSDSAPTTAVRAAIVVGDGSISWEILCQLVERLPVMVTPRWVETRIDPIGLDDAVTYLTAVLGRPEAIGQRYDMGERTTLTYRAMMELVATMTGRRRLIFGVPVLSPAMSALWLRLVTDVDLATAKALVDSMVNDVTVADERLVDLAGHRPAPFIESASTALAARSRRLAATRDDDVTAGSPR
jgi:uncharacterized protein YbjT (DUF2867 family)